MNANKLGRFEELLINVNIKTKNFEEFENAYKRLKVYNEDLAHLLPKSQELDRIVGLYLLFLLSFNRYTHFPLESLKKIDLLISTPNWKRLVKKTNKTNTSSSPSPWNNLLLSEITATSLNQERNLLWHISMSSWTESWKPLGSSVLVIVN